MKEDYYVLIKNNLIDNEVYARVKDYSKERNKVNTRSFNIIKKTNKINLK